MCACFTCVCGAAQGAAHATLRGRGRSRRQRAPAHAGARRRPGRKSARQPDPLGHGGPARAHRRVGRAAPRALLSSLGRALAHVRRALARVVHDVALRLGALLLLGAVRARRGRRRRLGCRRLPALRHGPGRRVRPQGAPDTGSARIFPLIKYNAATECAASTACSARSAACRAQSAPPAPHTPLGAGKQSNVSMQNARAAGPHTLAGALAIGWQAGGVLLRSATMQAPCTASKHSVHLLASPASKLGVSPRSALGHFRQVTGVGRKPHVACCPPGGASAPLLYCQP